MPSAVGRQYVRGFAPDAEQRPADDFYPTPVPMTRALLSVEDFDGPIWEPACGDGAIARVLEGVGHHVFASDLVDRGYGQGGMDFLRRDWRRLPPPLNIVTNPPYSLMEPFIRQAVALASRKVAILGRLALLEGQGRRVMWDSIPMARVWVFSKRYAFTRSGEAAYGSRGGKGGMIASAWFVWDKAHSGPPTLGWL